MLRLRHRLRFASLRFASQTLACRAKRGHRIAKCSKLGKPRQPYCSICQTMVIVVCLLFASALMLAVTFTFPFS